MLQHLHSHARQKKGFSTKYVFYGILFDKNKWMIMFKYIEIKIGTQSFQILLEDPPELLPLSLVALVKILQLIMLSFSKTSVIHLLWFSMLKNSVVSVLAGALEAALPIENPTYCTSRIPSSMSPLLQKIGVPGTLLKIC